MNKTYAVIQWGKKNNILKCDTYEDAQYLYRYHNGNLGEYSGVSLLITYS